VSLPPFQCLLDAHGPAVHRFLIATAGSQAAEDCYQETWLAALRDYPRLRQPAQSRAWLLTIARSKALDHHRAQRRAPVAVPQVPDHAAEEPDPTLPEIWERVRQLPEKQRTAVALRYLLDAAYPEMATVMGTSEAAARRNVHEGLKRLRRETELDQ